MSIESGWADIASAPRDREIIVWATQFPHTEKPFAAMASFDDGGLGWVAKSLPDGAFFQLQPSHWLPIPAPPK